jgi:hypothetical protein
VEKHFDFVWLLDRSDDTDLNTICLMKQLFFLETGSSEPDFELLRQDVVIRQAFDSLSIVVRHLKLSRHAHRGLNISGRRNWHDVGRRFVHYIKFPLELLILVFDCLVKFGGILIVVSQLDDLYSLVIEICLQFIELLVFLFQLPLVSLEIPPFFICKVASQPVQFLALSSQLILENLIFVKHNFESLFDPPVLLIIDFSIV